MANNLCPETLSYVHCPSGNWISDNRIRPGGSLGLGKIDCYININHVDGHVLEHHDHPGGVGILMGSQIIVDTCPLCGERLGYFYRVHFGYWVVCQPCIDAARENRTTVETVMNEKS